MKPDLTDELADFRREVKAVLDTALVEADAPLAVGDLKRGPGFSSPRPLDAKSKSCRVYTADGNDYGAVDRELALLEQSNAALFAALAQTRAMPVNPPPRDLEERMRSMGAREDARAAARLREAAEIQERERRRRHEKRRLLERTRDLKHTVSHLEKEKLELAKRLDDKRRRRERREREAREREERRRDEEARALRQQMGSTTREAERLRAKLHNRAEQASRARAREALWRWRARAAASVASRERKERIAAERAVAASAARDAERDRGAAARERRYAANNNSNEAHRQGDGNRDEAGRADGTADFSAAAPPAAEAPWGGPVATYQGVYAGGGGGYRVQQQHQRPYTADILVPAPAAASAVAASASEFRGRVTRGGSDDVVYGSACYSSVGAFEHGGRERERERERVRGWVSTGGRAAAVAGLALRPEREGVIDTSVGSAPAAAGAGIARGVRRLRREEEAPDQLSRLAAVENRELRRGMADAEEFAAAAEQASRRRSTPSEDAPRRWDDRAALAWRTTNRKKRAEALARSLALVLRAGFRARERGRVQRAFDVLKDAAAAARMARDRREARAAQEARDARKAAARVASVAAGGTVAAGVLWRARRRAIGGAFRLWRRASEEAKQKQRARETAFRRVVYRATQRARDMKGRALQQWRLAAAAVAMDDLRQQQRVRGLRRGAALAEAVLRRRDGARLLAGFHRWRNVDAEIRRVAIAAAAIRDRQAIAASAIVTIFQRCRRDRLRRGLDTMAAVARAAAEREQRMQKARLLAARRRRANRKLVLARCLGAWKAFASAASSARRMEAAAEQAQLMAAERRRFRAEQLAWVCKTAMAAADTRRKARAWRVWRQFQRVAEHEDAVTERVLLSAAERWRVRRLRAGLRRWKAGCEALQAVNPPLESRQSRYRSAAVRPMVSAAPRVEVEAARAAESGQVASLQKSQAARILLGALRSSRRSLLASAMNAWRSATARRVQAGMHVQSLALRTAHRQRKFFLGKAWSRIVSAGAGREAARARQLGAARTVHSLLASAARASRRRAWLRWRQAVAGAPAAERLQQARLTALQRCVRTHLTRDTRAAWEVLLSRAQQSRAIVSGAARVEGTLFRAQRRALSRRLGAWRSESLAEAIAAGERQTAWDRQCAGARLLASAMGRVRRRLVEGGWRALALFTADSRRAEAARASRSERVGLLAQAAVERARKRRLAKVWKAWVELLARRRLRGAVGAATSALEGQRASLERQVQVLRLGGAVRLLVSVAERSNRALLQRGWQALHQATLRRTALLRAVAVITRSRSQSLARALYQWRLATVEARAAQARAGAGRAVLAACLAGARGRAMQPAWELWRELVAREREEEEEFAGHEEALMALASVITRVAKRRDRERKARALVVWRLGAAHSAVSMAQRRAAAGSEVVKAVEAERADLLSAKVDCQHAGARLALRWLHRRLAGRQMAAWQYWKVTTVEDRAKEERAAWRARTAVQLARELARVVERRRHRILRRSLQLWYRHAERQVAHAATVGRDTKSREAGARRLGAVLERNLLRRKAKVWARLVGSAVATSGRLERERQEQARQSRFVAAAESRAHRRLLARSWLAWKGAWSEGRHRGEVQTLRAARGAVAISMITRRKEEEAARQVLGLWQAHARQARYRERAMSRVVSCLQRSQARAQQQQVARCLARWRLTCAVNARVSAEEGRVSAETAFRGQAVLALLRRKRLHRLSEGFRRLVHHRTLALYETREEHARRKNVSHGLHSLRRVIARRSQRRVMAAFARWRCFAAAIGQQSDRALLVSARRRAGAQALGALLSRREASVVSRVWTLWRSGAASAAVHDGERASADVRVSGARHSAGVRLLVTAMCSARRRVLWKAWSIWCREAKAAADAELRTMEMSFHLARTLTRIEKRNQLARICRAWRKWDTRVRTATNLPRIAGRVRKARLANCMNRWRLACVERRQVEAEEGRAVAEAAVRARALSVLVKRRAKRQLAEGFHRLLEHGAWVIYWSKEDEARGDRLSQGVRVLARVCARRRERSKLAALARWRYFASESRRQDDRTLLQAAGKRAGAKTLASLVSRRESSRVARVWAVWRSGATSAAAHEGERASADLRVFGARRSAGVRLVVGILGSARRRALSKAWSVWRREARAAARAEWRTMEKHIHLARTLTRIERRTQVTKMARAWRAWREVVRMEGEAEVQAFERNYHIAQTVTRVANRAQERKLSRAWGLWARLAARGRPRVSASLPSFPQGLLAAARSSHAPSLARAKTDAAAGVASPATNASTTRKMEERAERSRNVRHRAGAVAVRGLLRRAEQRCLSRSWQTWRGATVADATREGRAILGATRLAEILDGVEENRNLQALHRCWRQWVEWSTAEGGRLEQVEVAASWALAEAEDRKVKAAAGASALAVVTWRWEGRALTARFDEWVHATRLTVDGGGVESDDRPLARRASDTALSPAGIGAHDPLPSRGDTPRGKGLGALTPTSASPSAALSALRQRLRSGPSPALPMVTPSAPADVRPSPRGVVRSSDRFAAGTPSPLRHASKVEPETPASLPRPPQAQDAGERAHPGGGRIWWGEFTDSPLPTSPARPPSASSAGRVSPNEEMPAAAGKEDDHGSLDLTASSASISTHRWYSAGGAASPPFGAQPTAATAVTVAIGAGAGSPADSLAYMSDTSLLLGERVLDSLGGGGAGSGRGGVLVSGGLGREWAWAKDEDDVVVQSPMPSHREDPGAGSAGPIGDGGVARTPEHSRLRRSASSNGGSVGSRSARFARSPPYVGGSVNALGLSRGSPRWSGEGHGQQESGERKVGKAAFRSFFGPEETTSEEGGEVELSADIEMGSAEAFVARIRVVLSRRAFEHWVRVDRDAVYARRMTGTDRKVNRLRRQVKLRRVLISALCRQSYAWHINDVTRAMRKWREFVRKSQDDERLSLELSRISSMSPSPLAARTIASGLGRYAIGGSGSRNHSGGAAAVGSRDFGVVDGGELNGTPSFYRSPSSPATAGNSARRRLWDQA